jgi:hypothetical protein
MGDHDFFNRFFAITPSDTVNFPERQTAIYVGVGGTIAMVPQGGLVVTITAIAGALLPFDLIRINATGTTATGLVACAKV